MNLIANPPLAKPDRYRIGPVAGVDAGLFPLPARSCTAHLFLDFYTSQNEEHTSLRIMGTSPSAIHLGERVHHYLLLLLARRKLDDARRGLEADSRGWIAMDDMINMLGVDAAYLNIQIHRARVQFGGALGDSYVWPALIERRRGEVRLGACWFRIVRGSMLEGEFTAGVHSV